MDSLHIPPCMIKFVSCINIKNIFEFSSLYKSILRHVKEKYDLEYDLKQIDALNTYEHLTKMAQSDEDLLGNMLKSFKDNKKYLNTVKPKLNFLCDFYFYNNLIQAKEHKVYIYADDEENFAYIDENTRHFLREKLNKDKDNFIFIQKESLMKKILDSNLLDSKSYNIDTDDSTVVVFFDNYSPEGLIESNRGKNKFLVSNTLASGNASHKFEHILRLLSEVNRIDHEDVLNERKNFKSKEFISKYNNSCLNKDFLFLPTWYNYIKFDHDVTVKEKIIPGFKRGSKLLGVPTANVEITPKVEEKLKCLLTGVYFGNFYFTSNFSDNKSIDTARTYKGVLSIGYNPYFDNKSKTLEVFLIDYEGEDFYGEECRLEIKGYIRSESNFDHFDELVTTITYDIITAYSLLELI